MRLLPLRPEEGPPHGGPGERRHCGRNWTGPARGLEQQVPVSQVFGQDEMIDVIGVLRVKATKVSFAVA